AGAPALPARGAPRDGPARAGSGRAAVVGGGTPGTLSGTYKIVHRAETAGRRRDVCMSERCLQVGLVGAGMIGQLRARAAAKVAGLRLAAVADPCAERAQQAARWGRGVRVLGDGLALAADPGIDAVLVSTPPALHEPIGLACLRAGKHVLCEKPL